MSDQWQPSTPLVTLASLAARKPLTCPKVNADGSEAPGRNIYTHILATPEDEAAESFLIFHARTASSRCFVMKGLGSSVSMSAKVWLTSRWWVSSAYILSDT